VKPVQCDLEIRVIFDIGSRAFWIMKERGLSVSLAMLSSCSVIFFGSLTDIAVFIRHLTNRSYYNAYIR
jgi:hypothetical protein